MAEVVWKLRVGDCGFWIFILGWGGKARGFYSPNKWGLE